MTLDAWLPVGQELPGGARTKRALFQGAGWQILETRSKGRALIVHDELLNRWIGDRLVVEGLFAPFRFGERQLWSITSDSTHALCPISDSKSPDCKSEALAFALALRATRDLVPGVPLQDAIYVEKISRLLPTYSISSRTDDDVVLGFWLTGGASVSAKSFRRLGQVLTWLDTGNLKEVVEAAGFKVDEAAQSRQGRKAGGYREATEGKEEGGDKGSVSEDAAGLAFELPGRPQLESFFNEFVVDIVQNRERYKSLGIGFPSAVVLHGPPGCGKTFAVEKLVDFLGWPSFEIDASSVASSFIHETSKKIAETFDRAMQSAPSILVIDEMEAFLADREMGTGHHRVEEMAEFLRRIPEATKNDVLIVAMTNRIEMIDSAILRRGRFDHIIKVDYASEGEVKALLDKLLATLPKADDVNPAPFAKELAGRPLSDVAFVVREGARLAARAGKNRLDQESLRAAFDAAPPRERDGGTARRIGFV